MVLSVEERAAKQAELDQAVVTLYMASLEANIAAMMQPTNMALRTAALAASDAHEAAVKAAQTFRNS